MKLTVINDTYVRDEVKRDCYYLHYVSLRSGEIETPHIKETARDAIVGVNPQTDRYVCLSVNGRITWSKGYKTIKAAIKNAIVIC